MYVKEKSLLNKVLLQNLNCPPSRQLADPQADQGTLEWTLGAWRSWIGMNISTQSQVEATPVPGRA